MFYPSDRMKITCYPHHHVLSIRSHEDHVLSTRSHHVLSIRSHEDHVDDAGGCWMMLKLEGTSGGCHLRWGGIRERKRLLEKVDFDLRDNDIKRNTIQKISRLNCNRLGVPRGPMVGGGPPCSGSMHHDIPGHTRALTLE
ncbi:hypothetical protein CEXT_639391, partial [Caerostris extrusa]